MPREEPGDDGDDNKVNNDDYLGDIDDGDHGDDDDVNGDDVDYYDCDDHDDDGYNDGMIMMMMMMEYQDCRALVQVGRAQQRSTLS